MKKHDDRGNNQKKLFGVSYKDELYGDDDLLQKYVKMAKKLIKDNNWPDVYTSWCRHLLDECKTEEKIVNFVILFWLYEGHMQYIPNALGFCSYLYAQISFDHYPDVFDVLDGITFETLVNSGYNLGDALHYMRLLRQSII